MNRIRNTVFAAATVAAAFGAMAAHSNANAFSFGLNVGGAGGTSVGINIQPRSCWRWVDTPWGPQYQQFWGRDCRY